MAGNEIQRILERGVGLLTCLLSINCFIYLIVLRECKAVDLESLCIISGEKVFRFLESIFLKKIKCNLQVWVVKVDINILDHCGNMVDAAVLAAISSLVHFKRPHVEVIGDQVTL